MKTILFFIAKNWKISIIAVLFATTFFSCKALLPQKAEIQRLKAQIEAQTALINRQNDLIHELTARPTMQIRNDIKVGKKATIHNFNPNLDSEIQK